MSGKSLFLTIGSGLQVCTCLDGPGILDPDVVIICGVIRQVLQRGRGRSFFHRLADARWGSHIK